MIEHEKFSIVLCLFALRASYCKEGKMMMEVRVSAPYLGRRNGKLMEVRDVISNNSPRTNVCSKTLKIPEAQMFHCQSRWMGAVPIIDFATIYP